MGTLNIIPGASFPASIPKIPLVDGLESSGSLLLVEPGHSSNPWYQMPVTRAEVPNLLRSTADKVTGKKTANPVLTWAATDGKARVVRTRRGGVHIANNTAAAGYNDCLFNVDMPNDVADYIAANYTHRYFASVWMHTTAPMDASLPKDTLAVLNMQTETVFGIQFNNSIGARYGLNVRTPFNFAEAVGPYRLNAEMSGLKDMAPKVAPFMKQSVFQGGNRMLPGVSNAGKTGSYVFYRTYLEDLTVSGRSYAQLEALDAALYAQAFGPGGRYYGDSY